MIHNTTHFSSLKEMNETYKKQQSHNYMENQVKRQELLKRYQFKDNRAEDQTWSGNRLHRRDVE